MQSCTYTVLCINPGSTSTKIAVYRGPTSLFQTNITHSEEEIAQFQKITDQFSFRKDAVLKALSDNNIELECIEVVMGRGGLIKPVPSGVFEVNEAMKQDLRNSPIGEHASNLGGLIADDIAQSLPKAKAYIADPVVVDELDDLARISGHPNFSRVSIFHALNQKAIAREYARIHNKKYEDYNLIVAHMGGGITVGAHRKGKVIDVNQGLDGEGPFSPERSGTLPVGQVINICFSGEYEKSEIKKMVVGRGGLVAYFGTNNARSIEQLALAGDDKHKLIYEAMAYQVAKDIGSMYTVLKGEVDAIILTGGLAYSSYFTNLISERVFKLAPVHVYPGEDEMKALAMNGLMLLRGEIEPLQYNY
ncbi:MAG: butyrate kinase [Bacteroidales bacterium]|nr:butyrate kinase [Bacteroidales bacterium]